MGKYHLEARRIHFIQIKYWFQLVTSKGATSFLGSGHSAWLAISSMELFRFVIVLLQALGAVFGISCVTSHGLRLRSQGVLSDALASRHDRGAQRVADRHRCNYVRQDRGQIRLQIDPPVNREVSPFPSCRSPGLEHSS